MKNLEKEKRKKYGEICENRNSLGMKFVWKFLQDVSKLLDGQRHRHALMGYDEVGKVQTDTIDL